MMTEHERPDGAGNGRGVREWVVITGHRGQQGVDWLTAEEASAWPALALFVIQSDTLEKALEAIRERGIEVGGWWHDGTGDLHVIPPTSPAQNPLEVWADNGGGLWIVSPGEDLAVDVTGDDSNAGGAMACCRAWPARWWEKRQEWPAATVTDATGSTHLATCNNGRLSVHVAPGALVENLRAWLGIQEKSRL